MKKKKMRWISTLIKFYLWEDEVMNIVLKLYENIRALYESIQDFID